MDPGEARPENFRKIYLKFPVRVKIQLFVEKFLNFRFFYRKNFSDE